MRGINIFSGSSSRLGAALTNPTTISRRKGRLRRDYPVEFAGKTWPDAEKAYLALSRGKSPPEQDALMVAIIAAKLRQHPKLGEEVAASGGVSFLAACEHVVNAATDDMRAWEGVGRASRFIRNLIAAYEAWTEDPFDHRPEPGQTEMTWAPQKRFPE